MKVALTVFVVHSRINTCAGRDTCDCVAAVCVGIATLVLNSVRGHYPSCIVYEAVPGFQTDPRHLKQYTQFNLLLQIQIWNAAMHT